MPAPLRIAVVARAVAPLHGIGGLERSVHDLVWYLAARGVDVALISPPARSSTRNPFDAGRVTLHPVPYTSLPLANRRGTTILDRSTAYPRFGTRAGRVALALVERGAVDLVHGFGASVLGYARARPRVAAPLVVNPQGLEEFGATGGQPKLKHAAYWPLRRAVRATTAAADAIIATDRSLVPAITQHLSPRPDQVRVIPNGLDLLAVDALADTAAGRRMRNEHAIGEDDVVLVSVGRLEANKGFDVLAAALARASQAGGPLTRAAWRWVLVGAGPYASKIERAVKAHHLTKHTIFAGRTNDADLHAWYEAATLFVHPTRYEGSSLVTLEAMAHRRAVVASRAGGLPDKVRPGTNGWLVEPGDAAALASAIGEALADRARLDRFGAAGRAIVEREFAWAVIVESHLALYDELLQRARRR